MNVYFPKVNGVNLSELKISNVGKYSVSKPQDALITNKIISSYFRKNKKITITDACGNNGGNTINMALQFYKVNSVEIDKNEFSILKHNVNVYKLKNVKLYNDDYLNQMLKLKQDVVFIDAPWGGPNYYKHQNLNLYLGKKNIIDIVKELYNNNKYKLCVLKVPKNYNFTGLFNWKNIKFDIYSLEKYVIICIYVQMLNNK